MSVSRENLTEWAAKEMLRRYAEQAAAEGGRFPAERIMAKELEVSLPTLREGLVRLQTAGRIVRQHGKGTFLVPESASAKPIGILIEMDLTTRSSAPHYLPLALQIQRKLKALGRKSEIYFGQRHAEDPSGRCLCDEFVHAVTGAQLSAVAVVAGLRSEDWLAPLRDQGVPVVGSNSLFDTCISVDCDYWMSRAVDTLRTDGRRKVAFIGWSGRRPVNPGMKPAHENFVEHMRRLGLPVDPDLIRSDLPPTMEGAGWEEFREIWMRPAADRPDGLVVSDDILLRGCFEAIQESAIKMPSDLHIVALVSDYFRDCGLKQVSRFEISTEKTADQFVQALLHPGASVSSIIPDFIAAHRCSSAKEGQRSLSPNTNPHLQIHHAN